MWRQTGLILAVVVIATFAGASFASSSPATQPASTQPTQAQNLESSISDYADKAAPVLPLTFIDDDSPLDPYDDEINSQTQASPLSLLPRNRPTTMPATLATTQPSESKAEFVIAPVPKYVPQFGWGIVGTVGYIFPLDPNDKISPPSTIGAMGYYAENGSWAAGLASRLFLDEDHYRVTLGLFRADVRYDYFGTSSGPGAENSGVSIPLSQQLTGGITEALFQVTPGFYLGPKYLGANFKVSADTAGTPINIPSNEIHSTFSGLGPHAQWDTRDSQFYARKGYLGDIEAIFHGPATGDNFTYQVFRLSYNRYISLSDNQVLALRAMGQFENGDVPFYALSQFGRGSDLRGYPIGLYQNKQMFAVQAEYRLEITKRFGAVAFGGVGEVMPTLYDLSFENLLPSAGAGLRFVLAEKNHVSLRLDGAWGRDGFQYYFGVGEAF